MKKYQKIADEVAGALLTLFVVLAAIKFGTLTALPETPAVFPRRIFDYLLVGFPPSVFGIVAAVVLLLELIAGKRFSLRDTSGKLAFVFGILIPLGALLGAIGSPLGWIVKDYVAYFAGCGAIAIAAKLYVGSDEIKCRSLFIAVAISAFLICIAAFEQYFFGFARMRAFAAAEMARGIPYSAPMLAKLADDRVFATMTSANVLAGFLLLTSPFAVVAAAKLGKKLLPHWHGKRIFGAVAIKLLGAVLLLTKTRAAFLAALLILGLAVLVSPIKKWIKAVLLVLVAATLIAGAWYISEKGRGFSSATERLSYVTTSCQIVRNSPLAGEGWGSFFLEHMKRKTTPTDEVPRDPHNVILCFLTQCGIIGTLPVLFALLMTLTALFQMRQRDAWHQALFFGVAAFLLHSMVELNHLIPGAWGLFGILAVIGTTSQEDHFSRKKERTVLYLLLLTLSVVTLVLSLDLLERDLTYSRYREAVEQGEWDQEETLRLDAINAAPDAPIVVEIAGDVAWKRNDFSAAEKFWREAWELSPNRPSLCRRLSAAAQMRNAPAEAAMWEQKAKLLFPSDPNAR